MSQVKFIAGIEFGWFDIISIGGTYMYIRFSQDNIRRVHENLINFLSNQKIVTILFRTMHFDDESVTVWIDNCSMEGSNVFIKFSSLNSIGDWREDGF